MSRNTIEATKKMVKDFFSAIISNEVELTNTADLYPYESAIIDMNGGKKDIVVKAIHLPNYRYAYWVYIPGSTPSPKWIELEVKDKAIIYNESTGESAESWQIEKLRYSEVMAIKHQLELHKEEKMAMSDAESIYILGSAKKLDDLSAKISYGL